MWIRVAVLFAIWGSMAVGSVSAQTRTGSTQPGRGTPDRSTVFGEGEYRLGPEDVIKVFVYNEETVTTTLVIRPDGKISLPLAGELVASGKTANQLQAEVQAKLTTYIEYPVVNVSLIEVNSPKVSVVGEVRKPDVYKIKQKTTVVQAIALAGGLTEFAKKNKVIVTRQLEQGTQRLQLNLDLMLDGGKEPIFYLQPGDTVYVP